jgi:hypothetical protein
MMGKVYSTHAEGEDACTVLIGNPERDGRLGQPRLRWEDNIKINLKELRV